ncbi:hypothetical protein HPB48_004221 [Haemaphysalis longicornis]|uniref:Uncharacterized protein n=1 Tax=Haemaphysalis longicornis TaxID=44386 RepID=A0A9J6GD09_HAELO|nr:hypothetical protein HPB48_004221 [Haemaphysalis longicornis]
MVFVHSDLSSLRRFVFRTARLTTVKVLRTKGPIEASAWASLCGLTLTLRSYGADGVNSVQQASASLGGGASRSRLFSRDRLNTTDYMHTLATLDRRLAMDEILEKRRRAVFLQQIRCHAPGDEDDVFLEEGLFCPEPSPSRHPAAAAANVDDTSSGRLHQQHSTASLL